MNRNLCLCVLLSFCALALFGCGKDEASPEQAGSTLKKVEQHINEKDFDKAEDLLKKLEAKKDTYPEALQKQVEATRKSLETARAGEKVDLPKLPGS